MAIRQGFSASVELDTSRKEFVFKIGAIPASLSIEILSPGWPGSPQEAEDG
jgi:hypothetical protein